ncbi:MAG: lipoprotein signal peptidase, partial [Saprospiraceae bacterium]
KNTKNSSVTKAMQRFFEFFRRKNYGALWSNLLNRFYLVGGLIILPLLRVTYKKEQQGYSTVKKRFLIRNCY